MNSFHPVPASHPFQLGYFYLLRTSRKEIGTASAHPFIQQKGIHFSRRGKLCLLLTPCSSHLPGCFGKQPDGQEAAAHDDPEPAPVLIPSSCHPTGSFSLLGIVLHSQSLTTTALTSMQVFLGVRCILEDLVNLPQFRWQIC